MRGEQLPRGARIADGDWYATRLGSIAFCRAITLSASSVSASDSAHAYAPHRSRAIDIFAASSGVSVAI